jgi:hypothetical protein
MGATEAGPANLAPWQPGSQVVVLLALAPGNRLQITHLCVVGSRRQRLPVFVGAQMDSQVVSAQHFTKQA